MRGRTPKPVEQKIREGNPGRRKLPAPLELAGPGLEKPSDLPAAAALLWDEIVPILDAANILNGIDRAALTVLCVQWARVEAARKVIAQEGMFALGSTGQIIEHPAVGTERSGTQLFIRVAEQFGITPVARARIAAAAAVATASMRDELGTALDLDLD